MSACRETHKPSRRAVVVLLAVVGLLLVTGCGQQKDPTSFNDQTRASFIGTCSGTSTDPDATDNTANAAKDSAADTDSSGGEVALGTVPVCTCVYNKLVKGGFEAFKKANNQLVENPDQQLPTSIKTYVNDCLDASTSTTTKAGTGSTTTTAPTDTATDTTTSS